VLYFLLNREPSFEEVSKFQDDPKNFANQYLSQLTAKQKILLETSTTEITSVPKQIEVKVDVEKDDGKVNQ
jgi:hypothetical protein